MHPTNTELQRLQTGIDGLDRVLQGGLIAHDTHLLYGPPGTGKTVLCHQICFHSIRTLRMRCIYLNLLTESPSEIISHLMPFSFYDRDAVPEYLYYLLAEGEISKYGIGGLAMLIGETIQHRKAGLFIFEGIENALYQTNSTIDFVNLITQIRALGPMHSCTMILATKQRQPDPVLTLVDSALELTDTIAGTRSIKELIVHKTRGSAFLFGRHETELSGQGLFVYPRMESIPIPPAHDDTRGELRMATGIPGLDELMNGGMYARSNMMISGMPGSGKTTLGLSFLLEGAGRGQEGVYMGFHETPSRLFDKMSRLGLPLRPLVEQERIHMLYQSPGELIVDALAGRLLEYLKSRPRGEKRVFIDGIEGLAMATVYEKRIPLFFAALIEHLRGTGATTVISKDMPLFEPEASMRTIDYSDKLADSIVELRYLRSGAAQSRFVSVVKMRESSYRANTKRFMIGKGGITVRGEDDETEDFPRMSRIRF